MEKTVIAIFNYSAEAQEAVNKLVNEGLMRENIDVSYSTAGDTQGNEEYGDNYKQANNESGVSRFFKSLFGNDDEADVYTKVAGKTVLSLLFMQNQMKKQNMLPKFWMMQEQ